MPVINPYAQRTPVQVAYAAAGAGTGSAALVGTSIDVPYPTGIVAGSVLILHIHAQALISPTITTPSGWTRETYVALAAGSQQAAVYYKIADGTESGNLTVETINVEGYAIGARMYRFSVGTDLESAGTASTDSSGTAMDAVNVTSTINLSLACQLFSWYGTSTTIGNCTGESGGDYTEAVAEYHVGGTSIGMQLQTATLATAGAITGGSATLGASRSNRARIGFVINP